MAQRYKPFPAMWDLKHTVWFSSKSPQQLLEPKGHFHTQLTLQLNWPWLIKGLFLLSPPTHRHANTLRGTWVEFRDQEHPRHVQKDLGAGQLHGHLRPMRACIPSPLSKQFSMQTLVKRKSTHNSHLCLLHGERVDADLMPSSDWATPSASAEDAQTPMLFGRRCWRREGS